MTRDSNALCAYALGAWVVTGISTPVLLLVTTSWPHLIVAAATSAALALTAGMFSIGVFAGAAYRGEVEFEHEIERTRFDAGTHSR